MKTKMLATAWLAGSAALVIAGGAQTETFRVEGTSRVTIHVGKAGVFGFAGHPHEVVAPVTGSVNVDTSNLAQSTVVLEFESAALQVTGVGEPQQDVPEVQRVMQSDRVLDAARYPKIVFRSRRIKASGGGAGGSVELLVEGDLSLHGVTKPCSVPVRLTRAGGSLTAEGKTTLKQSDFGIQPVTAAGGSVRVRDVLDIEFTVRAAR